MASAAARQLSARPFRASCPIMPVIFAHGSGSPITPVEASRTLSGEQPSAADAASATRFAASAPALPVKAFALPLLTTSARATPDDSRRLHQSTGADGMRDLVKTPATCVPGASVTR